MNLGDILRGVGDTPLKGHTWTQAIVTTLNAILPSVHALTEESTGRDVLATMALMPEVERDQLLASEVDVFAGTLTIASRSPSAPVNDAKSESFHDVVVKDLIRDPPKTLALVFGFFMVIIALVISVDMAVSYSKTGKTPDTGLLHEIFNILLQLLKAFGDSNT